MSTGDSTKIGVATATIVGLNAMIGAGIFTAPAALAGYVGPAGILAFIFVAVAVWFIAQSLARLAQLYPHEGSFYLYARQWSGHVGGLIASGAYFLGLLIAMGLLSQAAGHHLEPLIPSLSGYTLGLIALALLVILNMFGVVLSEIGQQILIVCTVFPLVTTTLLCLTKADLSNLTPFAPYGFGNVFQATRVVIFGFFGFECAASLFNIVKDPEKNVPRALTYSIVIIGTLYTLFISSIILSTPLDLFTGELPLLSDILKVTFPTNTWIISIIHMAVLSAILGTVHSMIWSSSNLLSILVKKVKPKVQLSQQAAVLIVGLCIAISYVTLKKPGLFFNFTATFIVLAYMMSMVTLLTLKKEWVSGQNIKTLIGMATGCMIWGFALQGLLQEFGALLTH